MSETTTEILEAGTIVTWTSTSQGSTTTKKGEVVGFVPGKSSLLKLFPWTKELASSQDKISNRVSLGDRYLIRVDRTSKSGKPLQPLYYAPRASAVQEVKP